MKAAREQEHRGLGQRVAVAIIPCALLIGLAYSSSKWLTNDQAVHNLSFYTQHEHSAALQELHHAIIELDKEADTLQASKLLLEAAVSELKATKESLVAAQSSMLSPSNLHSTPDSGKQQNELLQWFGRYTTGPGADKWSGYLDAYHRHFDRFRSQDRITMVEVGVQSGGSIEMWRSYFGADKLHYIGVDVNPNCKQFEKRGVRIVIGDQGDPAFWTKFKTDFPESLDIFIDDGGHLMKQQTVTFEEMFWHVRDGGVYLCEDMHTSYWPDWTGGYLNNDTMIERSKALVDTLNAWHTRDDRLQVDEWTRNIRGLHFYDSMVFIDKIETGPMQRLKAGDNWIPYRRRRRV